MWFKPPLQYFIYLPLFNQDSPIEIKDLFKKGDLSLQGPHTDKQPHTHTHTHLHSLTPKGNLESPVSLIFMFLGVYKLCALSVTIVL